MIQVLHFYTENELLLSLFLKNLLLLHVRKCCCTQVKLKAIILQLTWLQMSICGRYKQVICSSGPRKCGLWSLEDRWSLAMLKFHRLSRDREKVVVKVRWSARTGGRQGRSHCTYISFEKNADVSECNEATSAEESILLFAIKRPSVELVLYLFEQ